MKTDPISLSDTTGFGVVVLAASAGGQAAILTVLRDLPLDFDVPIVVVQHLHPESTVRDYYSGRVPYAFEWVDEHSRLAPRTVLVCPARVSLQLLPDGSFHLEPSEGAIDHPIDHLLRSVARSFGPRAIAVVLTGMGHDGAAGAGELHGAGGRVLVQTESSAEFPEMPRAAVAAGAADLVVPLGDMAQVLDDLVAGAVRPRSRTELEAIERVFGREGEMAALARDIDWLRTPLGPVLQWPPELCLIAQTALESPHPTAVWWGRDLVQVYNDAWRRFLGASKHPRALGGPARETWHEVWYDIGPMVERVMREGVAAHGEDFLIVIDRHGYLEEVFLNFAYSPIRDARGAVVGVFNTCWETTAKVVANRRLVALRALTAHLAGANTPRQACEQAAAALAREPLDLPFALLYLFDAPRRQATLAGAAGVAAGSDVAPLTLALTGAHDTWGLQRLLGSAIDLEAPGVLLEDLERRVPALAFLLDAHHGRPAPRSAFVLPLLWGEDRQPIGALVAGISPHRPPDEDYRSFLRLVARQVSAGLAQARARELERERRERLAELDRAKTEFFANVSHEFRTPLTLLLSPLEELQRRSGELPGELAAEVEVAQRNARRLLRLVDSLLDFSQIEQRRLRAVLQPTNLGALSVDIASVFRSAIERAGLALRIDCPDTLPLVPVDRDMWEKVVSNLLSNALKFTFEGEIALCLRARALHVELVVSDTGIGIPKHELPNLFKRFHRVRGARARTIEGSGIGLALVHDLVTRMNGQVQVRSTEGRGSEFTVWMPLKAYGQALAAPPADAADARVARIAQGLAEEAGGWVGDRLPTGAVDDALGEPGPDRPPPAGDAHVLVAEDNADLRDYLRRLLGAHWQVSTVADGAEALRQARLHRPDLILADVMMPAVDGFALLRAVRGDDALKGTPVVFLGAPTGEDRAIEGLLAGADDYLAKPFSPRELIARVGGQIQLARARRRTQELDAFLVRFSDAVRGLRDAEAIAAIARQMIRERLGAARASWCVVDAATREVVVSSDAAVAGRASTVQRLPLHDWPFASPSLQGRPVVVDDTQADAVDPARREGWKGSGIGALLAVPVLVEGRLCAMLGVDQPSPRHWTPEEVSLVQGLAGRCWPEVERARAEAALAEELRSTKILQALGARLVTEDNIQAIYEQVLSAAIDITRARAGTVRMLDDGTEALVALATRGFGPRTEAYFHRIDAGPGTACGIALRTGQRALFDFDPAAADEATRLHVQDGLRSAQATPLMSRSGKAIGMVSTHWAEPGHRASERELRALDLLARQAADLIEQRRAAGGRQRAGAPRRR